jgi:acyl-coenzyme A thioesterase PaaI-like protein
MAVDVTARDPYGEHLRVTLVEAGPERAVVEQPADPEVDNHVKVRHASALYTAAYEASRQLLLAALGEHAASVDLVVADSEIAYKAVGLGVLRSVAEPQGEGWDRLGGRVDSPLELETSVVTSDPGEKAVVTLRLRWSVTPRA